MDAKRKAMLINHYYVLAAFNADYYKGLITKNHLGDESVIKVKGNQEFIFPIKYKGRVYAIPSKIVEANKLPIKISKSTKIAFNKNVYHYVHKYSSARIKDDNAMTFRNLIISLANFEHSTKDTEFLVYKIAMVMLYLKKGFMRVVSNAAFGKNSVADIIKALMTDVAVVNPRTTAAFEHKLINKMIVLDELTNLDKSQRDQMQDALLRVAGGGLSYEKGTRMSAKLGTKDEYDISNLSIAILYNVYEYYVEAGQADKYFDHIFQFALKDRFLPLYFEGILHSEQFGEMDNQEEMAELLKEDIKKQIRALKYYQKNIEKHDKPFKLRKKYILSKSGRQEVTFNLICQGLRLYAETEEEYNYLADILYTANRKYVQMVANNEVEEIPLEHEPVKKVEEKKNVTKQATLM